MTLGKERLSKIVGPTGFGAFDLDESGAKEIVGGAGLAALDDVAQRSKTVVDLVFIAGIAAEQEVIEVQTVLHDLVTDSLGGAVALQGVGNLSIGGAGLENRADVHDEQSDERQQDRPKTFV